MADKRPLCIYDGRIEEMRPADALLIPSQAAPAQTAGGAAVWDSGNALLTIGAGSGRKTMVDTDSAQTVANKAISNGTIDATPIGQDTPSVGYFTEVYAGNLFGGMKNRIIGGDFTTNPWQRGTGPVAISDLQYLADRFMNRISGLAATVERSTDAPPPDLAGVVTRHSYKVSVTTAKATLGATDLCLISQRIEGQLVSDFGFGLPGTRYVTLSFWVKSSVAGTYCVSLSNGPSSRCYVAEYTITAANTWEKKTITIPVDTTGSWDYGSGIGLMVAFALAAGSSFQTTGLNTWSSSVSYASTNQANLFASAGNTFHLALLQLEYGSKATPFEARIAQTELFLCRRYFQSYFCPPLRGVAANASTASRIGMLLPVPMRATPSVSVSGTMRLWDGNASYQMTSVTNVYASANQCELDVAFTPSGSVAGRAIAAYYDTNPGYTLTLNAEV